MYNNDKTYQEINLRAPVLFSNILNLYANTNDMFFNVKDANGKELVIYSKGGEVYKTNCEMVYNVEIVQKTENWIKDIPVNSV